MNSQIKKYQQKIFNKLFATLPSVKKANGFNENSNFDFKINHFYYSYNKDFWFTNYENDDKYYFLFGLRDKPINDIYGNDICFIIDFDKNIRFNNDCLGLFAIKNSEIHILINIKILKERYPNIDISDFKISKFKSFDNSIELEIIDLADFDNGFIDNIEKLIKMSAMTKSEIPRVVKTDALGNKIIITQMNTILEDLVNGKSENEAIAHANVSENTYNYWINRGKQDFGEIYVQFYQYINGIKSRQYKSDDSEEINDISTEKIISVDEGIYEPILAEYEDLFNSMNQTGIAWVDKTGSKWIYSRNVNGKTINLSADTITGLYEEVINNDLIWGIRDYDNAKKFIEIPDDFEIPLRFQVEESDTGINFNGDPNIYAPLPEEYEKSFNSMNQSGIAWVNQIGSKLYYVRSTGRRSIRLSGENIYDLYEKVKKSNQIWGIRDYDRARKFIYFPDDFEIPLRFQVEEPNVKITVEADSGIYAPLPEEYEKSFNSMNQSGIAWVNQYGKRWVYAKKSKGKTIQISDENIYMLYEKVKNANHIWGIRDYDRAKKFIDIPKDFEIPKKEQKEIVSDNEINELIYAPLSKDQLSKFNPNPNNKSGIAWVNKVGNQWFYQRQRNGKTVRISDSDIVKLHEKVINNNQIWGIIDINKARKAIETNSIDDKKPPKVIKPTIIKSNVTVNYIEKSSNEFEIIIKGVIKNKNLMDVLIRLDSFKENIKRIITTSINKESDIFIELEINGNSLNAFEEKIEDFGWMINK